MFGPSGDYLDFGLDLLNDPANITDGVLDLINKSEVINSPELSFTSICWRTQQ